jgi:WD40 repeat protein
MKNRINILDEIKQKIISQIDILTEEIKFLTILLCSRKYEESQKNINYNIFQNLENLRKELESKNNNYFEKIFEQGNKLISLFNHKIQILKPNNFKILESHSEAVIFLSQLKDGRLASSSNDFCLNIYKLNSFELQLSIKESSRCRSFIQINDGRIIACYDDGSIKLIKLENEDKYVIDQNIKEHSSACRKIIEIKQNKLISISSDNTMKIWNFNENKINCIKTIEFQKTNSFCNILKLNENEVVTSSRGDKCLKFWNLDNYQLISTINDIETDWTTKNMCLLEDDILCIGGSNSKGFYLVKISTHEIVKNINGPKNVFSIDKCYDGFILCSIVNENGNNSLIKYKYENLELKKEFEIVKSHPSKIYSCIELDNGIIAFGDLAHKIQLW